jgi:hypothetical protein
MIDRPLSLPELPKVCSVSALHYFREDFRFREFLNSHSDFELGITWAVNNYQEYICDLLGWLFWTRRETLRIIEKIPLHEELQPKDEKGILYGLASRHVHDLFDKGIDDLSLYLAGRWGFALFEEPDTQRRCSSIVETRNRIIHNSSIMDQLSSRQIAVPPVDVGDRLELKDRFFESIPLLARSIVDLDIRAEQQLGIPRSEPLSEERIRSE